MPPLAPRPLARPPATLQGQLLPAAIAGWVIPGNHYGCMPLMRWLFLCKWETWLAPSGTKVERWRVRMFTSWSLHRLIWLVGLIDTWTRNGMDEIVTLKTGGNGNSTSFSGFSFLSLGWNDPIQIFPQERTALNSIISATRSASIIHTTVKPIKLVKAIEGFRWPEPIAIVQTWFA